MRAGDVMEWVPAHGISLTPSKDFPTEASITMVLSRIVPFSGPLLLYRDAPRTSRKISSILSLVSASFTGTRTAFCPRARPIGDASRKNKAPLGKAEQVEARGRVALLREPALL